VIDTRDLTITGPTVTIAGRGEAGDTLTLFSNMAGALASVIIAADGTWSVTVALAPGEHRLTARQTVNIPPHRLHERAEQPDHRQAHRRLRRRRSCGQCQDGDGTSGGRGRARFRGAGGPRGGSGRGVDRRGPGGRAGSRGPARGGRDRRAGHGRDPRP
jgi:hypothetical protein